MTNITTQERTAPATDHLEERRRTAIPLVKLMPADDAVKTMVSQGVGLPEAKAAVASALEDPEVRELLEARQRRVFDPQPLDLVAALDAETPKPDWVVHGVIERGTVAILSGDTGAAKSILSLSLVAAMAQGKPWLGCEINAERVLVVDEEDPDGLVKARMRALGLRGKHASAIRVHSRQGWMLGNEAHDARLVEEIEEFRPDLLVIDTLMSTTSVDVNDNVAAVATMKRFRALARDHGCAVLLLHHERKSQRDGPVSGSSQQSMGARQWTGQTDAMLTTAVETDMKREDLDDGHFRLRRTFKVRLAEKDRDGRLNSHRRIAVESEKDAHERLLTMSVSDEGPIATDSAAEAMSESILAHASEADGEITTANLAAAVGADSDSGSFKRPLADLVERGHIDKRARGRYCVTDEGRKLAALPV